MTEAGNSVSPRDISQDADDSRTISCFDALKVLKMPSRVKLSVTQGALQGRQYVFDDRTTCIIGRALDCNPVLPDDDEHKTISRYHCLLDIDPPDVRIRDFGSLNGTYVNHKKIGQRKEGLTPEQAREATSREYELRDGDRIMLGSSVFEVTIELPVRCSECSVEIPSAQLKTAERSPGLFQCDGCFRNDQTFHTDLTPRTKRRLCTSCGRDIREEMGELRDGDFICAACRTDPMQMVRRLLQMARSGDPELAGIQDFQVLRELGKGSMGAVYLARNERTQDLAALKLLLPRIAVEERSRRAFLLETVNTAVLRHPNVVQLRETGCSRGLFYFTMEYCDGGSVDHLMKRNGGKLRLEDAVEITLQTLSGLDYAHNVEIPVTLATGQTGTARGLVHRDLKPHNTFVTGTGNTRTAKVGDFGLGKAFDMAGLSGRTRSGTLAGTPGFMPRQQVINFKYAKPEVDVWAAAASLYYMLTGGKFPREFPSGKDVWQTVLQTGAVAIREREPSVPRRLAEVIDTALIDKPAIQIQTAAELKRAIEGAL